ncbi:MAG: thioredoxin domain-containing protein [Bacteroidota bacterium]
MSQRILFLFLPILPFFASADGIEFFHGSWQEALDQAQEEDKLIFVDAFTTWCGPCKRMAANIFPVEEVGSFYNDNFVNVKLDMEKGEGISFRSKYAVTAFPTLLFINGKGELVHKKVGGTDVPGFIRLGQTALSKIDYSKDYAEDYEAGKRDPDLLYDYAMALAKSKKPSVKVANEYLRTQEELTSEKNLRFIHANAIEADSRIFSLMTEHEKAIVGLVGQEAYNKQIGFAAWNTVLKAIEYESDFLLEDAKTAFKEYYPAEAKAFSLQADMVYLRSLGTPDQYIDAANAFFKKAEDPEAEMIQAANRITQESFPDPKVVNAAQSWAEKACKKTNDPKRYMTLVRIYLLQENKKSALDAARKGLELAKEGNSGSTTRNFMNWVQSLEQELN